jgi:RNA polymerase sigma-54 factor
MNNRLVQQQTMKIALTKELRQAISILQFSSFELTQFITNLSLENPFIQVKESANRQNEFANYRNKKDASEYGSIQKESLYEHVLSQLEYLALTFDVRRRAVLLLKHLDSAGYIREDIHSLAKQYGEDHKAMEQALHIIQGMDPIGIGAQTLQQSLSLQLKHKFPNKTVSHQIVDEFFLPLAEKKWESISEQMDISLEEVKETFKHIQALNPRPGSQFEENETHYIVPDIYLKKVNDRYSLQINDRSYVSFSIDEQYIQLQNEFHDVTTKDYLKEKYQQAKWLFEHVQKRKVTMLKVMEAVLIRQKRFFDHGISFLQPLTLKDIAEDVELHESTVSRAVRGKYVETPIGVFELKYFFHSKIKSTYNKDISSIRVKEIIIHMISKENKAKPLSDQKICLRLKEEHKLDVSRRTVAKYREQLHIPASSLRKEF